MKENLELPSRLGWNGVSWVHGKNCEFELTAGAWFINGLGLDYQGIRGQLGDSVAALQHLQSLNMSNNLLTGAIPDAIGNLSTITRMKIKTTRHQMGARVLVTAWLLIYCNRSQYLFAAQARVVLCDKLNTTSNTTCQTDSKPLLWEYIIFLEYT